MDKQIYNCIARAAGWQKLHNNCAVVTTNCMQSKE